MVPWLRTSQLNFVTSLALSNLYTIWVALQRHPLTCESSVLYTPGIFPKNTLMGTPVWRAVTWPHKIQFSSNLEGRKRKVSWIPTASLAFLAHRGDVLHHEPHKMNQFGKWKGLWFYMNHEPKWTSVFPYPCSFLDPTLTTKWQHRTHWVVGKWHPICDITDTSFSEWDRNRRNLSYVIIDITASLILWVADQESQGQEAQAKQQVVCYSEEQGST